jgi:hypothetical protein
LKHKQFLLAISFVFFLVVMAMGLAVRNTHASDLESIFNETEIVILQECQRNPAACNNESRSDIELAETIEGNSHE